MLKAIIIINYYNVWLLTLVINKVFLIFIASRLGINDFGMTAIAK